MKLKSSIPVISIQGIEGSFHDIAKIRLFGPRAPILGRDSFIEVFDDVVSHRADYGIIAIENSLIGPIRENYRHLMNYPVAVVKELTIRISHYLIGFPGTKIRSLKTVHAHPMAFQQCRNFFQQHPHLKQINNADNAAAVRLVKNNRLTTAAALASRQAGRIYQMAIIKSHLEDRPDNFTRFLLIKKQEVD